MIYSLKKCLPNYFHAGFYCEKLLFFKEARLCRSFLMSFSPAQESRNSPTRINNRWNTIGYYGEHQFDEKSRSNNVPRTLFTEQFFCFANKVIKPFDKKNRISLSKLQIGSPSRSSPMDHVQSAVLIIHRLQRILSAQIATHNYEFEKAIMHWKAIFRLMTGLEERLWLRRGFYWRPWQNLFGWRKAGFHFDIFYWLYLS